MGGEGEEHVLGELQHRERDHVRTCARQSVASGQLPSPTSARSRRDLARILTEPLEVEDLVRLLQPIVGERERVETALQKVDEPQVESVELPRAVRMPPEPCADDGARVGGREMGGGRLSHALLALFSPGTSYAPSRSILTGLPRRE